MFGDGNRKYHDEGVQKELIYSHGSFGGGRGRREEGEAERGGSRE